MPVTLEELQRAILALPADDFRKFRSWFLDYHNELWDRELEEDAAAGRLDFLAEEAKEDAQLGELHDLP